MKETSVCIAVFPLGFLVQTLPDIPGFPRLTVNDCEIEALWPIN
jgi:hypothetical protein